MAPSGPLSDARQIRCHLLVQQTPRSARCVCAAYGADVAAGGAPGELKHTSAQGWTTPHPLSVRTPISRPSPESRTPHRAAGNLGRVGMTLVRSATRVGADATAMAAETASFAAHSGAPVPPISG